MFPIPGSTVPNPKPFHPNLFSLFLHPFSAYTRGPGYNLAVPGLMHAPGGVKMRVCDLIQDQEMYPADLGPTAGDGAAQYWRRTHVAQGETGGDLFRARPDGARGGRRPRSAPVSIPFPTRRTTGLSPVFRDADPEHESNVTFGYRSTLNIRSKGISFYLISRKSGYHAVPRRWLSPAVVVQEPRLWYR